MSNPDWDDDGLGIKPVINPFWAFILYLILVHYFCFSLWPLTWWKICVTFDLLNELTGNEFLDIASGVSRSTGIMLFFFCFAAGYNTTGQGATQQINEPPPILRHIIKSLNNSTMLTIISWLIPYVFLCLLLKNTNTEYFDGTPLGNLNALTIEIFPDFLSYYKLAGNIVCSIYFPFHWGTLFYFSGFYFILLWLAIYNFPFIVLIEPANRHFWQTSKRLFLQLIRR